LAEAGIRAIFASSGSVHDPEIQNFCRKKKIVLYFFPDKLGRGFFSH